MTPDCPNEVVERIELLRYYSTRFQRLRVDRAHGIAPHKPILLLSVIHLIKTKKIYENQIFLRQELIETFLQTWKYLGSEIHNPDISKPFFHLRGDKFWHHIPNPGFRKIITSKIKPKTFDEVIKVIKYAYIDDFLFEILQDSTTQKSLETVLVQTWFHRKIEGYYRLKEIWRND